MTAGKHHREETVRREIGRTRVSRPLALCITAAFTILIAAVPCIQIWIDRGDPPHATASAPSDPPAGLVDRYGATSGVAEWILKRPAWVVERNHRFLSDMKRLEDRLEEDSFLRDWLLAPGQYLLLTVLGQGNENVIPGKAPWLFYRPDVLHLVGGGFLDPDQFRKKKLAPQPWEPQVQPDPVSAILDFHRQLEQRGIALWLLPTPVKPAIHPKPLIAAGHSTVSLPLRNRSWNSLMRRLRKAGVAVFDPAPLLADAANHLPAVYLKADTHWRPEAMETVAHGLAATLRECIHFSGEQRSYRERLESVSNLGDLEQMLQLPKGAGLYPREEVLIRRVLTENGGYWQPETDAEILLMGDSFTNIYSLHGLGWGDGAGLAERLSFLLQQPVDLIAQNDDGAFATRRLLAASMARGRDRLKGKKVVIWQFANREFSSGNWLKIPVDAGRIPESGFFSPAPGQTRSVNGRIADVSRSPSPGSVPYRDSIVTLHLVEVRDERSGEPLGQAIVYAWGLRDNERMPLARVRKGDRISLRLTNWQDVESDYGSYRRTTLAQPELELEIPAWGEPVAY